MIWPEKVLANAYGVVSRRDYQVNVSVQVTNKLLADLVVRKCTTTQLIALISEYLGFRSFQFHLHPDLQCYSKVLLSYTLTVRNHLEIFILHFEVFAVLAELSLVPKS